MLQAGSLANTLPLLGHSFPTWDGKGLQQGLKD